MLRLALCAMTILGAATSAAQAAPIEDARTCFDQVEAGALDKAIDACTAALESGMLSDRNYSVTANNRGRAHLRSGAFAQAEQDFTKAISYDPKNVHALNNRGAARIELGAFAEAKQDLTAALALAPAHARAFFNRGRALEAIGEPAAALKDYEAAAKIDAAFAAAAQSRDRLMAEIALRDATPATPSAPVIFINVDERPTQTLRIGAKNASATPAQTATQIAVGTLTTPAAAEVAVDWEALFARADAQMRARSVNVRAVQRDLEAAGYKPGPIDNDYGRRTRAALRACFEDRCPIAARFGPLSAQ